MFGPDRCLAIRGRGRTAWLPCRRPGTGQRQDNQSRQEECGPSRIQGSGESRMFKRECTSEETSDLVISFEHHSRANPVAARSPTTLRVRTQKATAREIRDQDLCLFDRHWSNESQGKSRQGWGNLRFLGDDFTVLQKVQARSVNFRLLPCRLRRPA